MKDIYGLTNMYPVKKRYLDASVCATTFYKVAEEWWYLYENFGKSTLKKACLEEYCKWERYARIFERS